MPLARTYSVAVIGVTGHVVEIEADIANGLVGMILVGLPDTALREARDRIRAAIANSGEQWPQRKITVGLSPASLPKRGSWFDLAIAIGILAAAGKVPKAAAAGVMFFGELGLDGRLRPVCGVLPAVASAVEKGFGKVMVAEQNAAEAALVPGVRVIAADSLTMAADWLRGRPGRDGRPAAVEYRGGQDLPGHRGPGGGPAPDGDARAAGPDAAMKPDLAELLGQSMARRAAEVCAAGTGNPRYYKLRNSSASTEALSLAGATGLSAVGRVVARWLPPAVGVLPPRRDVLLSSPILVRASRFPARTGG